MSRVDIIVGKALKPMGDKPKMKMERKDPMHSSDFVQEIDMDEMSMEMETAGEAVLSAIKLHDAKALAMAICDLLEVHSAHEAGESTEVESSEPADEYK